MNITEQHAKKLLELTNPGLCNGAGDGTPGNMCVEQAVALTFGEPLNDTPTCVDGDVQRFSIMINDLGGWPSNAIRAKTMRRFAIAQLGSAGVIDGKVFAQRHRQIWGEYEAKRKLIWDGYLAKRKPILDEYEAKRKPIRDEYEAKRKPIWNEYEAKHKPIWDEYLAKHKPILDEYLAKRKPIWDEYQSNCLPHLETLCESLVQLLIELGSPGTKFLYLVEGEE